jgi:hypothetical protein
MVIDMSYINREYFVRCKGFSFVSDRDNANREGFLHQERNFPWY